MSETRLALGLGGVLLTPVLLLAWLVAWRGGSEVQVAEPGPPAPQAIEAGTEPADEGAGRADEPLRTTEDGVPVLPLEPLTTGNATVWSDAPGDFPQR